MKLNFFVPLPELCTQLCNIFETYPITELENLFPVVIANIFGIDGARSWALRQNASDSSQEHVLYFLSPTGPLFALCNKLCTNQYLRFNFPCNYLSEAMRSQFNDRSDDIFYSLRLQFNEKTRSYSLALNALEYYFFTFAHHLVNPLVVIPEYDLNITIYTELVMQYLKHFLPLSSAAVITQPEVTSIPYSDEYSEFELPRSPKSSSKLGFQIFREDVELNRSNLLSGSFTHSKPSSETWYNEMIVRIFIEFWLITEKPNSQNELLRGLLYNQSVSACNEHLKCVRALLKHLHYFSHNRLPGDNSPLCRFRKQVVPQYRVKIYHFFRYTVKHYPLNGSFLYLAETWLSYIQPWRYTFDVNMYSVHNIVHDRRIRNIEDWLPFIAENILTYTTIYYAFLSRFLCTDLIEFKPALILSRITKVFAQLFSVGGIDQIESCLNEDSSSLINSWKFFITQTVHTMECNDYTYATFNSHEHFKLAVCLIRSVSVAIETLRHRIQQPVCKSKGIFSWFGIDHTDMYRKTLVELTSCLEHLQFIHRVTNLEGLLLENSINGADDTVDSFGGESDVKYSSKCTFQERTEQWLNQILSNTENGDPDEISPRSWEISFFVHVFKILCDFINSKYSSQINELYNRQNFLGDVIRHVIQPPKKLRQYKKRCHPYGFTQRVYISVPARISLRHLASIKILAGMLIFYGFLACLGFPFLKILLIFLTLYIIYLIIVTVIKPVPIIKLDD